MTADDRERPPLKNGGRCRDTGLKAPGQTALRSWLLWRTLCYSTMDGWLGNALMQEDTPGTWSNPTETQMRAAMRTKITGSYADSETGAGTPDPEAQFFSCPCHRGGSTSSLRMLKAIKGRRVAPCMKHSPCSALCLELTRTHTPTHTHAHIHTQ